MDGDVLDWGHATSPHYANETTNQRKCGRSNRNLRHSLVECSSKETAACQLTSNEVLTSGTTAKRTKKIRMEVSTLR